MWNCLWFFPAVTNLKKVNSSHSESFFGSYSFSEIMIFVGFWCPHCIPVQLGSGVPTASQYSWVLVSPLHPNTVHKFWWNILYGTFVLHIPLLSIGFALRIKQYSGSGVWNSVHHVTLKCSAQFLDELYS